MTSPALSEEQKRYLQLVSPGAGTIDEAVETLRHEMVAVGGATLRDKLDAGLAPQFRRSEEANLSQEEVSALFADPGYFASNALNNLQKIRQGDKVALRLAALDEVARHAGGTVIDFGCGAGAQVLALRALGCTRIWAAEVDDALLRFVADRYRLRFGEELPLWNILTGKRPERLFAAALVLDVFPVIEDPAQTVRLLASTLLPGAIVLYNPAPITAKQRRAWAYLVGRDPDAIDEAFKAVGFSQQWRKPFDTHDLVCQRFDG
jgi:2-polyprenyl-3-methyl-5-hydroxy-6-metoxy-1,4-benzoquinol methylase